MQIWDRLYQKLNTNLHYTNLRLDARSKPASKSFWTIKKLLLRKLLLNYVLPDYVLNSVPNSRCCLRFQMSNNEAFPKNHDEFDFEFLGTIPGEPYTVQTNIYGNGGTHIGREQRFRLWFDPTENFHNYSFLWTANHTVYEQSNPTHLILAVIWCLGNSVWFNGCNFSFLAIWVQLCRCVCVGDITRQAVRTIS